jgi:hypothetical protein
VGEVRVDEALARGMTGALYLFPEERLLDFPRELSAYRDKRLASFEAADARSFELVFREYVKDSGEAGREVRIQGELSEGGWVTVPEAMDSEKASVLVAEMAHLQGIDVLEDDDPEVSMQVALGLSPPRLELRVWGERDGEGADALLADVWFGHPQPGQGRPARAAGKTSVMRVDESLGEYIPASLEAFRARFAPAEEEAPPLPGLDDEADGIGAGVP